MMSLLANYIAFLAEWSEHITLVAIIIFILSFKLLRPFFRVKVLDVLLKIALSYVLSSLIFSPLIIHLYDGVAFSLFSIAIIIAFVYIVYWFWISWKLKPHFENTKTENFVKILLSMLVVAVITWTVVLPLLRLSAVLFAFVSVIFVTFMVYYAWNKRNPVDENKAQEKSWRKLLSLFISYGIFIFVSKIFMVKYPVPAVESELLNSGIGGAAIVILLIVLFVIAIPLSGIVSVVWCINKWRPHIKTEFLNYFVKFILSFVIVFLTMIILTALWYHNGAFADWCSNRSIT